MKNLTQKSITLLFTFSLIIFLSAPVLAQKGNTNGKGKQKKEMSLQQDNQLKKTTVKSEVQVKMNEDNEVSTQRKVQTKGPIGKKDQDIKLKKQKQDKEKGHEKKQVKKKNQDEMLQDVKGGKGKVKEKKDKNKYNKEKVKSNNGNAYGKNKEGLSGREFGQKRAEEAKLKNKKVKKEHQNSVVLANERAKVGREKIKEAKEKLELEKESKKISEEEYKLKKEKIGLVEEAVNRLEEKLIKAKELEK